MDRIHNFLGEFRHTISVCVTLVSSKLYWRYCRQTKNVRQNRL